MQIKQLNWHPYAYNHDKFELYQIAYVTDISDKALFSYLIMPHCEDYGFEKYSLIIAGMSPGVTFDSMQEAKNYCQAHFESFFKANVVRVKNVV